MSIVALRKLTLVGLIQEKGQVLDRLQSLGCMHLLPLQAAPKEVERIPPEHAENARKALRYLMDVREKRHQIRHAEHFNMETAVFAVLANQLRLRDVSDRRDLVKLRIRDLAPWGDFELPQLDDHTIILIGHNISIIGHTRAFRRWYFAKQFTIEQYIEQQTDFIMSFLKDKKE